MTGRRRKRTVRVALIKAQSAWGDKQGNTKLFERLALSLVQRDVDVVVTPECFLDGYMVREKKKCTRKKLLACSVTGYADPTMKRVARVAKKLNSHIVFGASERGEGGVLRNAAYLLDREGRHVGTYYKVHASDIYRAGDDLPVFRTDFGTVGILICADRRWPENIRCMRLKGAEIVLNPTWGFYGELNTAIMRTRAYENGVPVCFAHPLQSLVCLQDGSVGAVLQSDGPDVLVTDIDLSRNVETGKTGSVADSSPIRNRRPDLYGALCAAKT
jgi:predicted amidohydrolase